MEFYKRQTDNNINVEQLQRLLSINNLVPMCASIDSVSQETENTGSLYCLWGAFTVHRLEIKQGVRFSLLECPHALAWSITFDQSRNLLIIHCTINQRSPDAEFIESINDFVEDWSVGLTRSLCSSISSS